MCPVGISATSIYDKSPSRSSNSKFNCSLSGHHADLYVDENSLETPPSVQIRFSSPQLVSPLNVSAPANTTLISLLHQLYHGEEYEFFREGAHQIFYSLVFCPSNGEKMLNQMTVQKNTEVTNSNFSMVVHDSIGIDLKPNGDSMQKSYLWSDMNRSRKLKHTANYSNFDEEFGSRCEGLDEICIQCMEIIEFLARVNMRLSKDKRASGESVFVNPGLSYKLAKQTEDPLFVAGGMIPQWCLSIPAFTPNMYVASKLTRISFSAKVSHYFLLLYQLIASLMLLENFCLIVSLLVFREVRLGSRMRR